jgi:putative addiction module killer protein
VEARPREIRIFVAESGRQPFTEWIDTLIGQDIHGIILGRIDRVEEGNFGDCKWETDGVFELRIDYGPGYRVYFGQEGDVVILLLGGKKKTQKKDLKRAVAYWRERNA